MGKLKNLLRFIKKTKLKTDGVKIVNVSIEQASKRLVGKNVLIAGGSSGIGLEIARLAISEGANVVITGRNLNKLKIASESLSERCRFIVDDISSTNKLNERIDAIENTFGGCIDCFVNSAGISGIGSFLNFDEKMFDLEFDTLFKGPFFFVQEIIKRTIEKKRNLNIIFISSNAGNVGSTHPYFIAKQALNSYAQGIAKSCINYGIRCNVVSPGITLTSINSLSNGINKNENIFYNGNIDERWHLPEEVANVVIFLLSQNSSLINGQIINCDCGDSLPSIKFDGKEDVYER